MSHHELLAAQVDYSVPTTIPILASTTITTTILRIFSLVMMVRSTYNNKKLCKLNFLEIDNNNNTVYSLYLQHAYTSVQAKSMLHV